MIVAVGHMGPLPRSDNHSQPTCALGRCQTSMMCCQSCVARFLSNPEFLILTRLNISAACCNEALYSPMIVAAGHMGPLPRSDNPSQPTCTLGRCQTSIICCQSTPYTFRRIICCWLL